MSEPTGIEGFDLWPIGRLIVPGLPENPPPPTVVPPGYVLTNWDPDAARWYPSPGAPWGVAVPPDLLSEYRAALIRLDELSDQIAALGHEASGDD